MTDDELKASWKLIKDPRDALGVLLANSNFIGSDPYYRDLNDALWEMADRVFESSAPSMTRPHGGGDK